jgi:hypothetical protein
VCVWQGWPELLDVVADLHRSRNAAVYLAAFRGRPLVVKMLRSHASMDGRAGEHAARGGIGEEGAGGGAARAPTSTRGCARVLS